MAEARTAVVVCDHHPLIRAGIRAMLDAEPDLRVVADLDQWPVPAGPLPTPESLVVIDERSYAEAAADGLPPASTVITADHLDDQALLALARRGVRGFVGRSGSGEDLIRAVRSVAAGQGFLAPQFVVPLLSTIRTVPQPAGPRGDRVSPLTARERDVLRLLASGARNRDIAAALGIAERTVKFHVSNLLAKTHLRTRAQLIAWLARRRQPHT